MVVKNLEFFDKDGYNLNLIWNEQKQIWEGNIFFPRVSVGLYDNTTIYVVEGIGSRGYSNSDSDSEYVDDVFSYPTGFGNISFQWDLANTFVDEFFMFNFDADYVIKDTSSLIYTPYDGPLCETLIINRFDKYIVPLLGSSPMIQQDDLLEVHVAFRADEKSAETTYKRTLIMSCEQYVNGTSNKYEIARITFFAETIEEDERLKIWNENLGYNLKPEDSVIFKQSNLHESMPNFELLNEKRKELMLEGHNIYPYIGGYKAIINAIKFFGYDNLNIVEHWRNINQYDSEYGKICRTYVYSLKDRKTISTKRKPISLDTKDFQKLNSISLVYNINHPEKIDDKKYDEYGLPNVIEDFDKSKRDDFILTIEESLVKLFALKKKLNSEFMPGSTKITDIIGEGNYFGINLIGNNPQISYVNYMESNGQIDFSVFPNKYCYITENEDFARYIAEKTEIHIDETIGNIGNKTIAELIEQYDGDDPDSDVSINEIDTQSLGHIISDLMKNENDKVCELYTEYYDITYGNNFNDANEYGLREEPEPRNVYKDIIPDDSDSDPYDETVIVPDMKICAKVILKGEFSDTIEGSSIVEWKIIHQESDWTVTHMGDVKKYGDVFVQLPYLGTYDVEMTVWDIYNHCSKKHTKNAIVVEPYNIDIRGFYFDARPLPDGLKYDLMIPKEYNESNDKEYRYYLWTKHENIGESDSDDYIKVGIITRKRNPMEISLSDIFGECDIVNINGGFYIDFDNIRDIDKENLINIVNKENDGDNVLKISWMYSDKNSASYGIDVYNFEYELNNVPFDENEAYAPEWNKDELYHVIKNNVDKMYSWALQEHLNENDINSTMRSYTPEGDVNLKGPYYKFDVDTILYRINKGYEEYNHLNSEIINLKPGEHYKYVRYINSVVNIKPLTWVLLGFDYSKITGRLIDNEYPKWTLTLTGDKLDPNGYYRDDKIITTHNGLYFTYLFEDEGVYTIKLELKDINGNNYEIEKSLIIVDKNANYEMYHTLKNDYDKYLEAKNERNLIYLN